MGKNPQLLGDYLIEEYLDIFLARIEAARIKAANEAKETTTKKQTNK